MNILLLSFFLLTMFNSMIISATASTIKVWARVSDLEGFIIANMNVDIEITSEHENKITGHDIMKQLALEKKINWGFTTLGGKTIVTEMVGRRGTFPITGWILSHLSPLLDVANINTAMDTVIVNDGDILEWRLTALSNAPAIETIPLGLWLDREQQKVDEKEKQREEQYQSQSTNNNQKQNTETNEDVDEWEF